ncbi:MAG: carboxypeptidase-like regulatory domain-containing protein [Bryobacteraceae bacterium]
MTRVLAAACLCVPALFGCDCQLSLSACREAAASDVVFIGTVESMDPGVFSRWNPAQRASLESLNRGYDQARKSGAPGALEELKKSYLKVFPDLPEENRKAIGEAASVDELARLFYWVMDHGKHVRLKVLEQFRGGTDDDAEQAGGKKDDGKPKNGEEPRYVDLFTPFGDCGFDFQVGETYLVYADDDEESNIVSTGSCSRTRRLAEAGDDLAYLMLLGHAPKQAGRLEGFVTTNELYQVEMDKTRDPERISQPVADVVVELSGPGGTRYADSDRAGRFVFDGLAAGGYTVTAYGRGYPRDIRALGVPKRVRVGDKDCAVAVLLVAK